jgi:hypothetical protein
MTEEEKHKINWLSLAMSLPIAYRDEAYYYNNQANLFGAFGDQDYLLLIEDFGIKYITQYTDIEISLLKSLCSSFITNQQDFVFIPRLVTMKEQVFKWNSWQRSMIMLISN